MFHIANIDNLKPLLMSIDKHIKTCVHILSIHWPYENVETEINACIHKKMVFMFYMQPLTILGESMYMRVLSYNYKYDHYACDIWSKRT